LFDIPLWSKVEAWDTWRERDSYDVETKGFAGTLGYRLFEYVDGYIGYRLAENNVKDISPWASRFIRAQEGKSTSSGLTATLVRDTSTPWMYPSQGSRNTVSVEHTGTFLQGDASYTRYGAETRWYVALPFDNVFSVRGEFGLIHGNEGKEVPIYERYYLGGIDSLRGLREVGPLDPENRDVIGGKTMMLYSAEVLFPILKDAGIRGVVFYDTGNTWESGFHFSDMRHTAGVGVRWNSPIGPFRLEWGHVLDRKEGESPSRWEFTIGFAM
ncbi:MAG: BamA/TamA family outer membrane protein, partial [Syntrophales bacterium]|nr:BamA/TamA family outer membrane protein [Syntrophales bacterium]